MLAAAAVVLLLVAAPGAHGQQSASPPPLPPPGRLIDVGGWRLHLHCTGERSATRPTVVLEAGNGDFSVDWSLVQPSVARFGRVCSYDRAGSAWSDLGPRPRTLHQIVYELHTLLERAGEPKPYVLVGHSYGGALVRTYRLRYPAEVRALVLVDAMSDDPARIGRDGKVVRSSALATGAPIPDVKTSGPLLESEIPPRIVELISSQLRKIVPHVNDPPRDKLGEDAKRVRAWATAQIKHAASNDNPVEAEELGLLRAERTRRPDPYDGLPLIVLSRGVAEDSARDEAARRAEQEEMVRLSRAGRQIVAARSGHHIPLDEPGVVVSAVRELVRGP